MATINRKSYSSTISPQEQPGMAKVIVSNITARGYLHLVTVRTQFVNEAPVEQFMDVLIHPDRALDCDISKFDAVNLQGVTGRNAPGEAKPNTQYVWANGAQAIGRHLVNKLEDGQLEYAGVGIYATAQNPMFVTPNIGEE